MRFGPPQFEREAPQEIIIEGKRFFSPKPPKIFAPPGEKKFLMEELPPGGSVRDTNHNRGVLGGETLFPQKISTGNFPPPFFWKRKNCRPTQKRIGDGLIAGEIPLAQGPFNWRNKNRGLKTCVFPTSSLSIPAANIILPWHLSKF